MPKKLSAECFKIVNKDGQPVLFRTSDAALNKLTFTITNSTGEPLPLTGGTPAPQIKGMFVAAAGASAFNISFESMLTTEVVKGLQLAVPAGWQAVFVDGSKEVPASWSIAPVTDTVIGINEVVSIDISNIICATTQPGNFEILYHNIPGYTDLLFPIVRHLSVLNPPDDKKKTLPLDHGYINPVHPIQRQVADELRVTGSAALFPDGEAVPIYITYDPGALIENGFTCILTNTSRDPLATATDEEDPANAPVVYLSFIFGDESYAITSQILGDNNISIDVKATLPWQVMAHTSGTGYWAFFPQSKAIIDGNETVYFPIKKIITQLNIPPDAISLLYIQLNNIPGHNDAAYTIQLQKKIAEAAITKLEADKYVIGLGENIHLTWVSSLARRVTISYETRDKETILLDSEKGDIKLDGSGFLLPVAPTAEYTLITATAYDNRTLHDTRQITITVNQVEATIEFTTPAPLTQANQDTVISWNATNALRLQLTTPDGTMDVTKQTSATIKVAGPATVLLEAWSYGTRFPAPVKATLPIYCWAPHAPVPLGLSSEVEQQLPAIRINKKEQLLYTLNSNARTVYQINTTNDQVSPPAPGTTMALSEDGLWLFTITPANDSGHIIALYQVGSGVLPWALSVLPDQEVYRLLLAPDTNHLFCTTRVKENNGKWQNYLVEYLVNVQARLILPVSRQPLFNYLHPDDDRFPRLMAFNQTCSRLYTFIDYNLLLVRYMNDPSIYGGIQLPDGTATAMLHSTTKDKLYLAYQGGIGVAVVDTVRNVLINQIHIPGSGPVNIALSPDDKYLCIACFDSGKVALADTTTDKVVVTFDVGNNPLGMSFSDDGNFLFVTNYCDKTLSVIDFNRQVVLQPAVPTGEADGNPCAVGVLDKADAYRVYVTKESWPGRVSCSHPVKNTSDNISVLSLMKFHKS